MALRGESIDKLARVTAERDAALARYAALRAACLIVSPAWSRSVYGYWCALCLQDVEPDQPALHDPSCVLWEAVESSDA